MFLIGSQSEVVSTKFLFFIFLLNYNVALYLRQDSEWSFFYLDLKQFHVSIFSFSNWNNTIFGEMNNYWTCLMCDQLDLAYFSMVRVVIFSFPCWKVITFRLNSCCLESTFRVYCGILRTQKLSKIWKCLSNSVTFIILDMKISRSFQSLKVTVELKLLDFFFF